MNKYIITLIVFFNFYIKPMESKINSKPGILNLSLIKNVDSIREKVLEILDGVKLHVDDRGNFLNIDREEYENYVLCQGPSHEICGFMQLIYTNINTINLKFLAIPEKYQNQGFGKKLINFVKEIAHKKQSSIVLMSSLTASEFYKKHGFLDFIEGVIFSYDPKLHPEFLTK